MEPNWLNIDMDCQKEVGLLWAQERVGLALQGCPGGSLGSLWASSVVGQGLENLGWVVGGKEQQLCSQEQLLQ